MNLRAIVCAACLVGAVVVATCKVAHAQAVNPSAIEFTSLDHGAVGHYRVCFYPSATSTTAIRCNDVPVSAAVGQGGSVFRIPRAAWSTGLTAGTTTYFPRVRPIGTNGEEAVGEVGPTTAPFFFTLPLPRPRDVSGVSLVP